VSDELKRTRREREKTEEEMLLLVERVIERIKTEMLELNI
jgi:hypothetical protein